MTNPTHETEAHKAERATARILEAAAKLGGGEGKSAGTFYGSRRILAQDIRNAPTMDAVGTCLPPATRRAMRCPASPWFNAFKLRLSMHTLQRRRQRA